ncbi:unnamed protein product [Pedinophyceae sp. YPF-701]|nr:unnamed protein product [Pedinophyceae sp. YPF-701]
MCGARISCCSRVGVHFALPRGRGQLVCTARRTFPRPSATAVPEQGRGGAPTKMDASVDPEFMKMAQEQMAKLRPEQMRAMQEQMARMSPAHMAQAQAQLKNMTPEQRRQAAEAMKNMNEDDITKATAQAQQYISSQSQHLLDGAEQLKRDGNSLFQQGRYDDAMSKYRRARQNCDGDKSDRARTIETACLGNIANCQLKLNRHADAASTCTTLLSKHGDNAKGYYRRGIARLALNQRQAAVEDLEQAKRLSPGDETVSAKLEEARAALEREGAGAAPAATEEAEGSVADAGTQGAEAAAAASAGLGNSQARNIAEQLKRDPAMARKAAESLKNMSDEQIEALLKQGTLGPGMTEGMSPDQVRMAATMMSSMSPEELASYASMAEAMRDGGAPAASGGASGAVPPQSTARMAEEAMKNPKMAEAAVKMMSSMQPEQLKQMLRSQGLDASDAQVDALRKVFSYVKPHHLQWLTRAAGVARKTARVATHRVTLALLALLAAYVLYSWYMRSVSASYAAATAMQDRLRKAGEKLMKVDPSGWVHDDF